MFPRFTFAAGVLVFLSYIKRILESIQIITNKFTPLFVIEPSMEVIENLAILD
jgi:hypothetical protein